jgi:hypothetical protein
LQKALHARDQIDVLDRGRIAGRFQIAREERCTGTATSTFGGGGGTKVFCSQALKMPIAATAIPARQAAAPFCAAVPYGLRRAGEREAFIFRAPIGFVLKKALFKNWLSATP